MHPETGAACIDLVLRPAVDNNSPLAREWELRLLEMFNDPRVAAVADRFCTADAAAPIADPSGAAQAFIRTIPLPQPAPQIAPGLAVTGLPAYLVIDNQFEFDVTEAIPGFGPMQVTLRPASFEVDWGDGTIEIVDDGRTGVAWENRASGNAISHSYVDRNLDTVVTVEARWVAEWSVGGFSGIVTGLVVEESLPLPVQEYRAVRVGSDQR